MIKLHEIKTISALALPLMAAFLAQKGMQLVDTIMMGWIGPDALAAGAIGTSIFMTVIFFCMGTLSAVGIFIVRAKGANDNDDIQSSVNHGLLLALFLSFPCMLIIWLSPYVLTLIGQDSRVIENSKLLLNGLILGLPGFLLFLVFREFICAFSLTRTVMLVSLSSIPLTLLCNYILIYGKFGFPVLGIAGIGYAGAIVMWYMFLSVLIYSKKHASLRPYIIFNLSTFSSERFKDILFLGIPSGSLFVFEAGMFVVAAIMMGYFGINALAAHQIALQCASIAYSIPFSLSMSTSLQVGHAAGSKNIDQMRHSTFLGLGIGLVVTSIIAIIFILFPEQLAKMFLKSNETGYKEIIQLTASFLTISAFFQCIDGIQAIANGALRGLKDTLVPMLISVGCYWIIGIGSSCIFFFYTDFGAVGIWYGLTLGICNVGIILAFRLFKKLRY